ncbi:MAG: flagellar motor protein MotB [Planctomycetaceae bacterium]|nr:OmpA family protein [Planctomycetaceae bacterium]
MKRPAEEQSGVPIWILSFGDMITNLLACFVMLLAFATSVNDASFKAGQGSFKRSISQCGLPSWLFGREDPVLDSREVRYPTTQAEKTGRVIDAEEDEIRREFEKLTRQIDTQASAGYEQILGRTATCVTFADGAAGLTDEALAHLKELADTYRQNLTRRNVQVVVTGLAPDGPADQAHALSARRANAAAEMLRRTLAREVASLEWEISAWGAGRGEAWAKAACADVKQTFIIITLVTGRT